MEVFEGMGCIILIQNKARWWVRLSTVMELREIFCHYLPKKDFVHAVGLVCYYSSLTRGKSQIIYIDPVLCLSLYLHIQGSTN